MDNIFLWRSKRTEKKRRRIFGERKYLVREEQRIEEGGSLVRGGAEECGRKRRKISWEKKTVADERTDETRTSNYEIDHD